MIDYHNHFLPNVDDGPKVIEETLDMLKHASCEQGITEIVQTVHFQHPKMENKNVDFNYLSSELKKVKKLILDNDLNLKIHLAAEVFYLPNLSEICLNPLLTIGKTKYMLIEFSNTAYPTGFEDEFYKIQLKGITPIVAHPERYMFVKNNINVLEDWINRGYIIQLGAGSILGHFGDKTYKVVLDIIDKGFFHLIGSDAHNNRKRNFCLKDAYSKIENFVDVELLKENAFSLVNGGEINNFININKKSIKQKISSYIKQKIFKL